MNMHVISVAEAYLKKLLRQLENPALSARAVMELEEKVKKLEGCRLGIRPAHANVAPLTRTTHPVY